MKKVYSYLLFFVATASFAQLSVKPSTDKDNYMYVKGTVLYVGEDINISKNTDSNVASIYLRNKAQLLQGRTDTSLNTGDGKISVFQEGTANAYTYNYWSSPVSNPGDGTTDGNRQFSVALLGAPISSLLSNSANMVSGYTGSTSNGGILNIAPYWIYKYASANGGYANWSQVGSNEIINAGEGFTMKGVNGTDATVINGVPNNPGSSQRYDFRGRPNDGLITVSVGGVDDVILIGNPYPSALDLNYFLLENSGSGFIDTSCTSENITKRNATTGIAYFWDSDPSINSHYIADYSGGYASYSPNGSCSSIGVYTPPTFYNYTANGQPIDGSGVPQDLDDKQFRRYLPIGQGFFVQAPSTGTIQNIQFKNSHRKYMEEGTENESVFGRNADLVNQSNYTSTDEENVIPKIRFNIAFDDDYTRQIALAFDEEATTGADPARDALNFDQISADAGFLIGAKDYVIDIRPFNAEDRLPLYLNLTSQKNIAINVNNFENFDTENVYIYDKDTGEYHPIKDNYFYITLPAGNYSERFEITFQNGEENLAVADEIAESFTVFQDNRLAQLQILNPKGIDLKNVSVFDMSGKQVLNNINLGANNKYIFSTANLAEAVYVVRIVTNDNIVTTKKISILNRG